uniref:Uncharacterized protein n=1 Tax=Cacopsylla melanoneura TaxID=428564 RepID=A0A8D9F7B7_9HEMI
MVEFVFYHLIGHLGSFVASFLFLLFSMHFVHTGGVAFLSGALHLAGQKLMELRIFSIDFSSMFNFFFMSFVSTRSCICVYCVCVVRNFRCCFLFNVFVFLSI